MQDSPQHLPTQPHTQEHPERTERVASLARAEAPGNADDGEANQDKHNGENSDNHENSGHRDNGANGGSDGHRDNRGNGGSTERRPVEQPVANRLVLVDRRAQAGWSQAELARRAGISQGHLSEIERGITAPRPGTLSKLAAALYVDVAALLVTDLTTALDTASDMLERAVAPPRLSPELVVAARRLSALLSTLDTGLPEHSL